MRQRTVDWSSLRRRRIDSARGEGLREMKKREMRQLLSDTATEMVMERGFDAVRVADVAKACRVSEKTVFNYFPTKESLILDRWDSTLAALRSDLADRGVLPLDAALRILREELSAHMSWIAAQDDQVWVTSTVQRFLKLIRDTPSLRAYELDKLEELAAVATEALAERAGMSPGDPEPRMAAIALIGLWHVELQSMRKYLDGTRTASAVHELVAEDVRRAARLIAVGPLLRLGK